ncbi:hypothetical protein KZ829_15215 [Actinoplanes hulinensis]|uniref:Uncharacterized protein n=1 Tax=Actinoplanes hulinensis TaxID=1144547 RepID=A0ABS7B226_9ACTN|nr:hypothetical protein [Actinoplanes hulinensis]MBW6435091.1 hypothetical protein [Actinoplanes hulinensis]
MSSDFAFWKAGSGNPAEIYDALAEGVADALEPHPDVAVFRGELLERWPDLVDVLEPGDGPGDRYVLLTLPLRMLSYLDGIFELAGKYELHGYSGVAGEPF